MIGASPLFRRLLADELRGRGLDLADPVSSPLEGGLTLLRAAAPYAQLVERLRHDVDGIETGEDA